MSPASENQDESDDSYLDGDLTPQPKRVVEICRDGSLRGVGDSPIVLDYRGSTSDISDPNIIESPKGVEEELTILDEVVPVSGEIIEKESPYVMLEESTPVEEVDETYIEEIRDISSPMSDDPETDKEVARVLGLEDKSSSRSTTSERKEDVQTMKHTLVKHGSQDTLNQLPSDEEVELCSLTFLHQTKAPKQVTSQFGSLVWCCSFRQ